MELNENLEHRGHCKLPVSEREVAMPRASAGFVQDSKVPGCRNTKTQENTKKLSKLVKDHISDLRCRSAEIL